MAGIVHFSAEAYWGCSSGAFRDLVAGVVPHLADSDAGIMVRKELMDAVDSGIMFVAYDKFTADMRSAFVAALKSYSTHPATLDSSQAVNPELYHGYLARIGELMRRVEKEA